MTAVRRPAIFLSYSHTDVAWCAAFAAALRADGFDVWFDEELHPGEAWIAGIERELQAREVFILVLSPDAWASEWVQREYQLAVISKRHIITLMLKETAISGFLLILQWISVEHLDAPAAAQMVAGAITEADHPQSQPLQPEQVVAPTAAPVASPATEAVKLVTRPQPLPSSPLPARIQPRLFIWSVTGAQAPQIVPIRGEHCTLGREADNDLVLADPAVSRHHLVLVAQDGGWMLQAQPGAGTTYLNGHPTTQANLQPFDQIALGTTVMRFELAGIQQRRQLTEASLRSPLLLIDSPMCHFVAPLREPLITLGRSPDSGVIVPSPIVARRQAQLERAPDAGYVIADLGATNPLLFQGKPFQQRNLKDGDTLTIDAQVPATTVIIRYVVSPL